MNFGLARDYGGVCHLRFDDTNPEKEDTGVRQHHHRRGAVAGLRLERSTATRQPYQASDYFDFMYRAAEYLIEAGHAYVDEQTRRSKCASTAATSANPASGQPLPQPARRPRTWRRFREMRDGQHEDGAMVLRAKIDMASPNINMRDPAIYRIRRATHHNTGDKWCIYPMYTFAHPIEDALEQDHPQHLHAGI